MLKHYRVKVTGSGNGNPRRIKLYWTEEQEIFQRLYQPFSTRKAL